MQNCTLCILYQDLKYHILSFSCGHVIIILSISPPNETLHAPTNDFFLMKENIKIWPNTMIFYIKMSNKNVGYIWWVKNSYPGKTGILRN